MVKADPVWRDRNPCVAENWATLTPANIVREATSALLKRAVGRFFRCVHSKCNPSSKIPHDLYAIRESIATLVATSKILEVLDPQVSILIGRLKKRVAKDPQNLKGFQLLLSRYEPILKMLQATRNFGRPNLTDQPELDGLISQVQELKKLQQDTSIDHSTFKVITALYHRALNRIGKAPDALEETYNRMIKIYDSEFPLDRFKRVTTRVIELPHSLVFKFLALHQKSYNNNTGYLRHRLLGLLKKQLNIHLPLDLNNRFRQLEGGLSHFRVCSKDLYLQAGYDTLSVFDAEGVQKAVSSRLEGLHPSMVYFSDTQEISFLFGRIFWQKGRL